MTDHHHADIDTPPRPPAFVEFNAEHVAREATGELSPGWRLDEGHHSWSCRAQTFVVTVTWLAEDEVLDQADVLDEHVLLVPEGSAVEVSRAGDEATLVKDASVVVIPPGASRVVGRSAGFVLGIATSRATGVVARAGNGSADTLPGPAMAPVSPPTAPRTPAGLEIYPVSDASVDPSRPGSMFRTGSLMIDWRASHRGPGDPDRLAPRRHDDLEHASVALSGEYVHHVRRPWTARLRDWRPDEHVHVHSPSVAVVPPGNIHTTRAVGPGDHQLIDVFSPLRGAPARRGWVHQAALEDEWSA